MTPRAVSSQTPARKSPRQSKGKGRGKNSSHVRDLSFEPEAGPSNTGGVDNGRQNILDNLYASISGENLMNQQPPPLSFTIEPPPAAGPSTASTEVNARRVSYASPLAVSQEEGPAAPADNAFSYERALEVTGKN